MQRVTRATAAASLPTPPASPGTPGFFGAGNPGGGIQATIPGYEWFNAVQEELMAFLAEAGIAASQTDLSQVLRAARQLIGKNVSVFTANGTFTAPANVTLVRSRVWSAGGGGGFASGANAYGSSGGGGAYVEGLVNVVPGTGYAVTVGLGGAAGISGAINGGNGGSSAFAGVLSATGGGGGLGNGLGPGAGGTSAGGYLNVPGQVGGANFSVSGIPTAAGGGGAFGTPTGQPTLDGVGKAGMWPGGGGGGGSTGSAARNGGAGAAGLVIVEW